MIPLGGLEQAEEDKAFSLATLQLALSLLQREGFFPINRRQLSRLPSTRWHGVWYPCPKWTFHLHPPSH